MADQTIIRITSRQQIIDCVDLYLAQNQEHFMRTSKEQSYKNLFNKVRLGRFVRAVEECGKIVAWIYAEQVILEGAKEIVLTGVNIGDFGKSTEESFFQLVKALDALPYDIRFRISSGIAACV